jgi:glutathione S-transferase
MATVLFVGNKNFSSWSLRPWLCLRWACIPFETRLIRLDQPGYGERRIAEVLAISPAGTVPALEVDGLAIWDSLAIAEWAAEQVAPGVLWPADPATRAVARAVTAEMHSGFAGVRRDLPMNLRRRCPPQPWLPETQAGIERIVQLWDSLRARHAVEGPWLFGKRSIADAFYTPVATRFRSYGVELSGAARQYAETLLADADFRAWEHEALTDRSDAGRFPGTEGLYA